MNQAPHEWIDRADLLPAVADALRAAPWIALDSESNSMFVYREEVCLIQLNAGGRLFVVDTLAIKRSGGGLEALKTELERSDRPCWLHGGEYDVGCLKRDYGITMGGIWDSQQAASLLGWERTGYGAAVEKLCGVVLDKGHAQYDWGTRPLDPAALCYAVDDVVYLPKICELLRAEVTAADIEEEIAIANQAVSTTSWTGGFDPGGFWRIKGVRDVPMTAMPVLAAMYVWRDGIAQAANKPPGRMLNNESLLAVARHSPNNFQLLKRAGLKGWFLSAHGEELLTIIKEALDNPQPLPPRPKFREVLPIEEEREDRLKEWRRAEAEIRTKIENRPVPLQVVLPAKALEYLKQHGAADLSIVPQLGAKRMTKYGDKLRELAR